MRLGAPHRQQQPMIMIYKEFIMMRRFYLLVQLFLFLFVIGTATAGYSAEAAGVPSYGKGPVELIIFFGLLLPLLR